MTTRRAVSQISFTVPVNTSDDWTVLVEAPGADHTDFTDVNESRANSLLRLIEKSGAHGVSIDNPGKPDAKLQFTVVITPRS
ncbi:MAG: hypothetical protein IIC60_02365 [Proteobacteria bacterium]|nr:hypothetical protein [Pseudomonadota bacterium]